MASPGPCTAIAGNHSGADVVSLPTISDVGLTHSIYSAIETDRREIVCARTSEAQSLRPICSAARRFRPVPIPIVCPIENIEYVGCEVVGFTGAEFIGVNQLEAGIGKRAAIGAAWRPYAT